MKKNKSGFAAKGLRIFFSHQRQAEVNLKNRKFEFVQVPETPAFAVWKGVLFY